jgi:hypothetical protein
MGVGVHGGIGVKNKPDSPVRTAVAPISKPLATRQDRSQSFRVQGPPRNSRMSGSHAIGAALATPSAALSGPRLIKAPGSAGGLLTKNREGSRCNGKEAIRGLGRYGIVGKRVRLLRTSRAVLSKQGWPSRHAWERLGVVPGLVRALRESWPYRPCAGDGHSRHGRPGDAWWRVGQTNSSEPKRDPARSWRSRKPGC